MKFSVNIRSNVTEYNHGLVCKWSMVIGTNGFLNQAGRMAKDEMREEWERECGRKLRGGAVGCGGGSGTDAPEDPCDHHKLSSQHPYF